jgi:hypothetical protein
MGRNNADLHGGFQFGRTITDDSEGYEQTLHTVKSGTKTLASAQISELNDPGEEALHVDWLESNETGKGHAQRLIQHLYDTYPRHTVNFGLLAHPASEHIALKFAQKYPNRTEYRSNSWKGNRAAVERINAKSGNLKGAQWSGSSND